MSDSVEINSGINLTRFYTKRTMMAISRRKKTIVYCGFALVLIIAFVQVTYFNEAYSPLQVLSDARSEARRLLKFLTLYHYQCNTTIQGVNISHWQICLEKVGGLNLVLGGPRLMYSVGPTSDYMLERLLSSNYSYSVNIFHHQPLSADFLQSVNNRTRIFKTVIVPNDPADYGRNSYETQTLNNAFELLQHPVVDILKIETLQDTSHAHELVYYMVKDHLLSKVRQFHMALHIDKVDDDFLYSWYRALYKLFHEAGFRLYHTGASDTLCLQVTLMESCIYYMSWIRDPGPETFILYPPAMDGSEQFEVDRLQDFVSDAEASCNREIEVNIPLSTRMCMDVVERYPSKACQLVILRTKDMSGSITFIPNSRCSVVTLEVAEESVGETVFTVKKRRYERSLDHSISLEEGLQMYLPMSTTNLLYLDLHQPSWALLTSLLDSGALFNVEQLILDIKDIWGTRNALEIRKKYSELRRVEAYGFRKLHINEHENEGKLVFHAKLLSPSNENSYKINYLKTAIGRSS